MSQVRTLLGPPPLIDMNFEKNNTIRKKVTGHRYFNAYLISAIILMMLLPIGYVTNTDAENEVEEDGNMLYFKYDVSCYLSNNTRNDYGLTLNTCPLLDVEINLPNGRTVDRTLVSPQQWRLGIDDMPYIQLVEEDDRYVKATTYTRPMANFTALAGWTNYTDEVLIMSAAMTFSFRMDEAWNEDSLWVFNTSATVPKCEYCYSMWGMNDSIVDHRTVRIHVSDEPFSPDNRAYTLVSGTVWENGNVWDTASTSFSFDYNDIIELCQKQNNDNL